MEMGRGNLLRTLRRPESRARVRSLRQRARDRAAWTRRRCRGGRLPVPLRARVHDRRFHVHRRRRKRIRRQLTMPSRTSRAPDELSPRKRRPPVRHGSRAAPRRRTSSRSRHDAVRAASRSAFANAGSRIGHGLRRDAERGDPNEVLGIGGDASRRLEARERKARRDAPNVRTISRRLSRRSRRRRTGRSETLAQRGDEVRPSPRYARCRRHAGFPDTTSIRRDIQPREPRLDGATPGGASRRQPFSRDRRSRVAR